MPILLLMFGIFLNWDHSTATIVHLRDPEVKGMVVLEIIMVIIIIIIIVLIIINNSNNLLMFLGLQIKLT